ncbi:MAG TPA: type 4a pilus biogenesis protein PilO [Armatimonadota bacterium]|nr:type 4a pilus biogenesis protein PilO [Armatimonadota bacterium]
MPRIKPSKKALICLVALALVLLVVCSFTYHKGSSRVHALTIKIEEKQKRLSDSEQVARRLCAVEQAYVDAQTTLSALEQGVSTKAYVPTLLRQVEELGKKVNLRVVGVRPRPVEQTAVRTASPKEARKAPPPKKPEPYDKLDLDMEINGKYWDVVRFLQDITCFPKIITVNDVQISTVGQPTDNTPPMLAVRLSTTAFILKGGALGAPRNTEPAPAARAGRGEI